MTRYSFVIQVHPGGVSTLENLATRERVKIDELDTVGSQIERWLNELEVDPQSPSPAPSDRGSRAGSDSRSGRGERGRR